MSFIEETKEKEAAKERWKPWYSVPIIIQEREESKFDYAERIQKQWEETHSEPFFSPFCWRDEIPTPKGELHRRICQELNDTYKRKNADYGDSFAMVRDLYPDMAIMVRIYDKVNRLRTLLNGKQAEVDESIDDSLMDLANYCIMELMERRVERGKVVGQNNQSRTIFDPEP